MTDFNPILSPIINPIGYLSSCFKKRFGTPRQGALTPNSRAYIELKPEFINSLEGLEEYSHVWLISWLHQSESTPRVKIRPPRMNGDRLGVFATRGPHRPNPIGLTLATVQKVDRRGLWVQGMDLIEGTPILDIKPYVARYDSVPADNPSKNPAWIDNRAPFTVEVAPKLLQQLEELSLPDGVTQEEFIQLAKDSLIQDPRPPAYKERHHELYYLWLYDLDVECQFDGIDKFKLLSVKRRLVDDEGNPP